MCVRRCFTFLQREKGVEKDVVVSYTSIRAPAVKQIQQATCIGGVASFGMVIITAPFVVVCLVVGRRDLVGGVEVSTFVQGDYSCLVLSFSVGTCILLSLKVQHYKGKDEKVRSQKTLRLQQQKRWGVYTFGSLTGMIQVVPRVDRET